MEGYRLYGKNWKKIKAHVGTRTGDQIRSHAQKMMHKIEEIENPEAQGCANEQIVGNKRGRSKKKSSVIDEEELKEIDDSLSNK